jgi:hypothetical protein
MLPNHGKVLCRKCFAGGTGSIMQSGNWRIQNEIAFASLIRCSVARIDEGQSKVKGNLQ